MFVAGTTSLPSPSPPVPIPLGRVTLCFKQCSVLRHDELYEVLEIEPTAL